GGGERGVGDVQGPLRLVRSGLLPAPAARAAHPDHRGWRHDGGGATRRPARRRLLPGPHPVARAPRRGAGGGGGGGGGGRDPKWSEITVAAPTDPAEIEGLARQGITRVGVPVSAAAGLPAQVKTPEDVLRYGRDVVARFRVAGG